MIKLFCYGSLNQSMIEALIGENLAARPKPGILNNHVRIFAEYSPSWNGAVASVYPHKGLNVYGAVVELTKEQFAKIDEYEGSWYRKVKRKIYMSDISSYVYCFLYEIIDFYFKGPPSKKYLNSIRTTLRAVGYDSVDPIKIYGIFSANEKDLKVEIINQK
jgi:gamma-glutamylcyclotransferase (GGCT)/AIG2-like uncharacterized protein YtfP